MDHRKLFQVLVIGGALLGAGCTEAPPEGPGDTGAPEGDAARPDAVTPMADSSPAGDAATPMADSSPAGDAATPDGSPGELEWCGFCPNDCCVTDGVTGESRERDGFMCCWGTTC
jgi:hypothetical protein